MNQSLEYFSFLPFFKAISGGRDVRAILEIISERLNVGSALREEFSGRITVVSESEDFQESAKTFPTLEMCRIYVSRDVRIGNLHSGILFLDIALKASNSFSREQEALIENAVIATALCLDRSLGRPAPEDEKRGEVLKGLLTGDLQHYREARDFFTEHGWDKRQPFFVLLFHITENTEINLVFSEREKRLFLSIAQNKILSFFPKSFCVYMADTLAFAIPYPSVIPEKPGEIKKTLKNIASSMKEELPYKKNLIFHFAAGGIKNDLGEISKSYDEAMLTIKISEAIKNKSGVAVWDLLGSSRLLAMLSDTDEARLFCVKVLGELMDEDTPASREHLRTLAAMDMCNWNINSASKMLRFHYNTIKYRLGVIRERISFDYNDPTHRFEMSLALRLAPFFSKTDLSLSTKNIFSDLVE